MKQRVQTVHDGGQQIIRTLKSNVNPLYQWTIYYFQFTRFITSVFPVICCNFRLRGHFPLCCVVNDDRKMGKMIKHLLIKSLENL